MIENVSWFGSFSYVSIGGSPKKKSGVVLKKDPHENRAYQYLSIKLVVFTVLAIFVYAFHGQHVEHLKPFAGSLMLVYGIDGVGYEILTYKKRFLHASKTYLGIVDIAFGVVLMVAALLLGLETVPLMWDEDELNWDMYRACAKECKKQGLLSPIDLLKRIVSKEEYDIKWNKWCDNMQAKVLGK